MVVEKECMAESGNVVEEEGLVGVNGVLVFFFSAPLKGVTRNEYMRVDFFFFIF